jgi:hypothetical protein
MQYRGVDYMVVRTIPRGWRWSVKREGRTEKAGSAYSRANGMVLARKFIDQLMNERERSNSDMQIARPKSGVKHP